MNKGVPTGRLGAKQLLSPYYTLGPSSLLPHSKGRQSRMTFISRFRDAPAPNLERVTGNFNWSFTPVFSLIYKKFWEELVAYFPSYDSGRIDNDVSNNSSIATCVFVTAVTFLPSHCLATVRGYFYRTKPLPSNDRGIHTQTDGRDVLITPLRWAQVPWYKYQVS
jgi:hypothetical protein